MSRRSARVLALDVPIALFVGVLSLGAAHARGPWSQAGSGPPWAPGGPEPGGPPPWAPGAGPEFAALPPLAYVCVAVVAACLAVRRFRPRTAFACAMIATAVFYALDQQGGMLRIGPALLAYTMAAQLPLRQWTPWTGLAVPLFLADRADRPYIGLFEPGAAGSLAIQLALLLVPAALGVIVRSRRESTRRERDDEVRRSVYEERLRIAREVHDVVGHSLSVINMQAGVALHVLGKRPEQAEPALQAIRRTSKDALEELRGTLAVFRIGGEDERGADTPDEPSGSAASGGGAPGPAREPVPGLDRIDELAAGIDPAGDRVRVRAEGERTALPAAVEHAAFRIVQEALTNAVRHGGGAATVTIGYHPEELTVEITDSGHARPGRAYEEGSGIAGMRERARAVGGRLQAGPRADGGFRVRAELPAGER
ncbi:sensor histidine kinase [Streptomonospora wellingtoniae]|uniref:histidine kinase n=1 Tax=Streptomonospora wellingtoniae TaxID=3075544 RepID=A0ABU2KSE1_9ACTN|nr:histidine kinase [Streptomonospora sp. DSM 45055]MDT0302204.1 histidine kinase [Streptomonospora sp. DSM 45055]